MPSFRVTFELSDAYNRTSIKRFETSDDVADFDAAQALAAGMAADIAAVSELRVLAYDVSQRTVYSDSVTSGANKDEAGLLKFRKADLQKASVRVPGIIAAARMSDGTIDVTNTAVSNFAANFLSAPGFTLSDGETASELIGGVLEV